MRIRGVTAVLGLAILLSLVVSCGRGEPVSTPRPSPVKVEGKEDVTKKWTELYADSRVKPPTEYRKGHVKPRKLDTHKLTETEQGFEISLPGSFPIPTPTIYQDRLYVSGGFGSKQYYCFNAETGKPVWAVDLDDDGPSTAAAEDGVIVVNTESCTIFTLEASSGKMLWSLWLGDPLLTAPTIARGRVFTSYPVAGAGKHYPEATHLLGAFDLKTGEILWQRWLDGDVMSAPVAIGDEIVAATFTGTVFRFRQDTGELLSALKARATSAPIVVGKDLFFSQRTEASGTAREALAQYDGRQNRRYQEFNEKEALYLDEVTQSGAEFSAKGVTLDSANGFAAGAPQSANALKAFSNVGQASVSTLQAFQGSRILRYGASNYACMGDEIVCTDPAKGKTVWSVKLPGDLKKQGGFMGTPPVAAGTSLFVGTFQGEVLQLEPAAGKIRKRFKVGAPVRFPPAVEGGRIYVGTQNGRVICIDTGDAKNTGWPTWGRDAQRTGVYPAK